MDQRSGLPNPALLKMPLRDMARGLKRAAHLTQDTLAPVVETLPTPLQSALSDALTAIKSQGKSVIPLTVKLPDIGMAAGFMAGRDTGATQAAKCAKVMAFAWDRLKLGDLASETVLASHLGQIRAEGDAPEDHAAAVLTHMADSHAFGKMPGFPLPEEPAFKAELTAALIAPTVWLLAEREASVEEELRLLDLSSALVQAFDKDIRGALGDQTALAPLLKTLARHL